nr:hypothetical protein [Tanacetum cinerariifolium]
MINYMPTYEAKEIRAERGIRNHDPLALVANTYNPPSTCNNPPPPSNQVLYHPQHSYDALFVQQQAIETPKSHDSRLAIPTFNPTDDLIGSLNKAIMFLSKVFTTKYPTINNKLRTSSNPMTQANVQDGRVTIQNVQRRQTKSYGNNGKGKAAGMDVIKTVGDYAGGNAVEVIKCYNCKGTRHYAKQCTANKRVMNSEWFKEKMLIAKKEEEGELNTTSLFMADRVDAFDSDCDEDATSVPNYNNYDMFNLFVYEMQHLEQPIYVKDTYVAETNDNNVILDTSHTNTNEDDVVQHDTSGDQENAVIMSHEHEKLITHFIPMISLLPPVQHISGCSRYSSSSPALLELPSAFVSLPSAMSFTTSLSIGRAHSYIGTQGLLE